MSKTNADAIALTRTFLDEAQPEDFTAQEVQYAVNNAYQWLISKVVEVYQEFYLTTTPTNISTVEDQQEYSLGTTFLKIERVEIDYDPTAPNSNPQRALAIKMDDILLNLDNAAFGGSSLYNAAYYVIGAQDVQKIGFIPIPNVTATNNVQVWGIEAPADLSATSDSIRIPYVDNFWQIIGKYAAGQLLKKGQQAINAANDLLNEANVDILNMQTFISERQSDGPNMIGTSQYDDINVGDYVM